MIEKPRAYRRLAAIVLLCAAAGNCSADKAPAARGIAIPDLARTTPVDFAAEIVPILKANCLACHNANTTKGDLSLEAPQSMLEGGTNGPAVVAGDSKKSRLLQMAAQRVKPIMPPANNRVGAKALTPEQLGLIRLWIDQGAINSTATRPTPIVWQPPAPGLQPILAVAVTPDGKYAACSRADQLFVYDLPAARLATRLADPELSGRAHVDFVRSLAFNRQGDLLASGGFRTVKLWQRPRTRQQAASTLDDVAGTFAINPTGTIAAYALPGRIVLCDLASGKQLRSLGFASRSLCFSPDGTRLCSGGADKTIRVWKVEDGAGMATFLTPASIHAVTFINQGTRLVTGHEDGRLRVWDLAALTPEKVKPLAEIPAHARPVTSLAAVPGAADQVISASDDGRLRHWDLRGLKLLREFQHGSPIAAIAARPDGTRFASAGNQGVRLWDAATGNLVAERKGDHRAIARIRLAEGEIEFARADLYFHQQELRDAEEAVKREKGVLEAAKKQVEMAQKALAEKQKAAKQPLADKAAADKAATEALAALNQANAARKEAEKTVIQARTALAAAQENAGRARTAAAKEPKNADLARASEAAAKAVTDAMASLQAADKALKSAAAAIPGAEAKNRAAANLANQAREKAKTAENQLKDAETAVETATFTVNTSRQVLERNDLVPRAKQAIAAAEAVVKQREAAKKTAEQAALATERPWRAVAFSSDSAWLLAGGEDGLLHVFDAQQGFPSEVLDGPGRTIVNLAAGAKGKLAALAADKKAALYQTAGGWTLGRTIGRVDDPRVLADRVLKVDFHPNGTWLATAGGEAGTSGELKIWNVADGRLVREFPGAHRDAIFAVQFSPNGEFLATGSADRLVRIFRTADGKLIHTLTGHTHHVRRPGLARTAGFWPAVGPTRSSRSGTPWPARCCAAIQATSIASTSSAAR